MSRKANCWDNAPMESFFAVLKTECFYNAGELTVDELMKQIDDYMDYYNRERCSLKLKKLSPVAYRTQLAQSAWIGFYECPRFGGQFSFQTTFLLCPIRYQPLVAWVLPTNKQRWLDSDVRTAGRGQSPRYGLAYSEFVSTWRMVVWKLEFPIFQTTFWFFIPSFQPFPILNSKIQPPVAWVLPTEWKERIRFGCSDGRSWAKPTLRVSLFWICAHLTERSSENRNTWFSDDLFQGEFDA